MTKRGKVFTSMSRREEQVLLATVLNTPLPPVMTLEEREQIERGKKQREYREARKERSPGHRPLKSFVDKI